MKLTEIFRQILVEQEPLAGGIPATGGTGSSPLMQMPTPGQMSAPTGSPMMPGQAATQDIIEFRKHNFAVSTFPSEKRIQLSPIDNQKAVNRIRSLIANLRDDFRVSKVVQLDMNIFDVTFDPTENFDKIKSYILAKAG